MTSFISTADGWAIEDGDANADPVRVQNVCGFFRVEDISHIELFSKSKRCVFGVMHVAYTIGGNLSVRGNQLMFKGATDAKKLRAVVAKIVSASPKANMQLMVLSVGIGSSLHVHVGCLLEKRLGRFEGIEVMNRIEEVCNIVVFYVRNWDAIGMEWEAAPVTATATLTRRGTLTLRLTWDEVEWKDNRECVKAIQLLQGFVIGLLNARHMRPM